MNKLIITVCFAIKKLKTATLSTLSLYNKTNEQEFKCTCMPIYDTTQLYTTLHDHIQLIFAVLECY